MRLLLYCTKNKWRLFFDKVKQVFTLGKVKSNNDLNGKIVAECDYEVEEIRYGWYPQNIVPKGDHYYTYYKTSKIEPKEFYKKSCLNWEQLNSYLNDYDSQKFEGAYAIHIKNLHIFEKPRELNHYMVYDKSYDNMFGWEFDEEDKYNPLTKAPQNMMYCCTESGREYVLISIRPEYLVDILNGEKTIEVRKKVLKEMLKYYE